eukprot:353072-Chlamydomonas_euryale.AAC.1
MGLDGSAWMGPALSPVAFMRVHAPGASNLPGLPGPHSKRPARRAAQVHGCRRCHHHKGRPGYDCGGSDRGPAHPTQWQCAVPGGGQHSVCRRQQ